jgi:hypothetical protein
MVQERQNPELSGGLFFGRTMQSISPSAGEGRAVLDDAPVISLYLITAFMVYYTKKLLTKCPQSELEMHEL